MISIAWIVLELAAREPGASALVAARGIAARDAAIEVATAAPLYEGEDGAERTAALLVAWSYFESRWNPAAVSPDGMDCGIMQVRRTNLPGGACSSVKTARAGYAAGLRIIHAMVKQCGSVGGALVAYASGGCKSSPKVSALVVRRCDLAGGC